MVETSDSLLKNQNFNLVKQQKDRLISGGKDALSGILTNATKPKTDTTKTNVKTDAQTRAKDLLNNIFNKKKKEEPKKAETPPPATTPTK